MAFTVCYPKIAPVTATVSSPAATQLFILLKKLRCISSLPESLASFSVPISAHYQIYVHSYYNVTNSGAYNINICINGKTIGSIPLGSQYSFVTSLNNKDTVTANNASLLVFKL